MPYDKDMKEMFQRWLDETNHVSMDSASYLSVRARLELWIKECDED